MGKCGKMSSNDTWPNLHWQHCKRRKIQDKNGLPVVRQRKHSWFRIVSKRTCRKLFNFFSSRRHRHSRGLLVTRTVLSRQCVWKGSYDQKWKSPWAGEAGRGRRCSSNMFYGWECTAERHKIFSFLSPFITVVHHPHTTTFSLFRQNVLVSARPPPMNCWSRQVTPTYLKSMKPIRAKSELIFTLFMDKRDPPPYQYLPFVNTAMIN